MDKSTLVFQRHRARLFGIAYRMLGTPGDAEDVLHDAWLRLQAHGLEELEDPEGWLITVTSRLSLDRLRRAKAERERYVGPWLPEPLAPESDQPELVHERDESLRLTFLLLLERLSPDERAAFLLHDVFEYSHGEAAKILGIADEACRQRAHRAKVRLRDGRPRFEIDAAAHSRLLNRFIDAMARPSLETLRALFAEDAVHISDGGGIVRASLHPLCGADRLARLYLQIARHLPPATRYELGTLNGLPAVFWLEQGAVTGAMWIDTDGAQITAIHSLRHPGKLARLGLVVSSRISGSK
ncbi:RNA polymerase sigma factor SigJ [Lysobacter soli]|uniref:RNA polymerase sigma factor SigJ n=1 Tax=Lysobacter soli TaxID=453783 RepID=UPI003CEFAB00